MSPASHSIPFVVATAGHVDHGKSELVRALTNTDTDRLPEEKRRGITIDLGFARWQFKDPKKPSREYDLGVVDVPGHEDFVKNMVSGIQTVDLALMVVAADDGWMPQTEEHLQILQYLAIPNLVIAVTKADLATGEAAFVMEMIREELMQTAFEQAPIIATSTKTREGLDTLQDTVADILRSHLPRPDLGKPRLAIDRLFSVKGMGTVVTGSLEGGTLETDQAVQVQPGNIATKIRSIQHHHDQQARVLPGMRTAVNLPGVPLHQGNDHTPNGIKRGQVVTLKHLGRSTSCFDAVVSKSIRLERPGGHISGPLKGGTRIRVHLGTANVAGRIVFPKRSMLAPGDSSPARLQLEHDLFVVEGDYFVLRDWSQQGTIAGGRIWDADATMRKRSDTSQVAYLDQLMLGAGDAGTYLKARLGRDKGLRLESLASIGQWTLKQLAREAAGLTRDGTAVKRDAWLLEKDWWEDSLEAMARSVLEFHKTKPDKPGFPIETARRTLEELFPDQALVSTSLAELQKSHQIDRAGECLCHESHRVALPDRLLPLADQILKELAKNPTEPPARKHMDTSRDTGDTLRCLIRMDKVVDVGPDLIMLTSAYETLVGSIRGHIEDKGPSTVSDLRQALGVSRRIAIPLLERLDRVGLTRREGDLRHWSAR
ncbi:selenocysteine-specific translation elongation factor [bacterium]|nr:selenocysteine-specific translation elongation factor [bacterium]